MKPRVTIQSDGTPGGTEVLLDGVRINEMVSRISWELDAGSFAHVTLRVHATELSALGDLKHVLVARDDRDDCAPIEVGQSALQAERCAGSGTSVPDDDRLTAFCFRCGACVVLDSGGVLVEHEDRRPPPPNRWARDLRPA